MQMTYVTMALAGFLVSGCATSLEQIVDEHHQARIDASNANRPVVRGAADGLGRYIAQSQDETDKTANP